MYSNFGFMRTELESGWFATQIEDDDLDPYGIKSLIKVCVMCYVERYFFLVAVDYVTQSGS